MQIFLHYYFLISVFVENAIILFIDVLNLLSHIALNLLIRNAIGSSHSERVSNEPVIDDTLSGSNKLVCGVRTDF